MYFFFEARRPTHTCGVNNLPWYSVISKLKLSHFYTPENPRSINKPSLHSLPGGFPTLHIHFTIQWTFPRLFIKRIFWRWGVSPNNLKLDMIQFVLITLWMKGNSPLKQVLAHKLWHDYFQGVSPCLLFLMTYF